MRWSSLLLIASLALPACKSGAVPEPEKATLYSADVARYLAGYGRETAQVRNLSRAYAARARGTVRGVPAWTTVPATVTTIEEHRTVHTPYLIDHHAVVVSPGRRLVPVTTAPSSDVRYVVVTTPPVREARTGTGLAARRTTYEAYSSAR